MEKLKYFLLAVLLGLLSPISCTQNVEEVRELEIESLSLSSGRYSFSPSLEYEEIDFANRTDTIHSDEFAMAIAVEEFRLVSDAQYKHPLVSTAQADPVPPSLKTAISLVSVYCTAPVMILGQSYQAGDNLIEHFRAGRRFGTPQSVLSFVAANSNWSGDDQIYLMFQPRLTEPFSQKLQVVVTLEDNTTFELESELIVLN